MTGDRDPAATPDDAVDLAEAIGENATVAIVEDAGHGVYRDNPRAFLDLMGGFLGGLET